MMKMKTKVVSVAAAATLAMTMSVPAFASVTDTSGTGDYNGTLGSGETGFDATTTITADVTAPDAKVISVTIPSTLAMPIATKTDAAKTVLDTTKTPSQTVQVKNNADSTTNIKVEVSGVDETADATSGKYLSDMVKVLLASDEATDGIVLGKSETYTNGVLAANIAAGASKSLTLSAAEKTSGQEVSAGSYTLKTTLKVSAVS